MKLNQKLIALFVSSLLSVPVSAAEWILTADVEPSVEYNDNVFMSEDEQSSVHYVISPTVSISHALDNMASSLDFGYKIDRYISLSDLDTENPFIQFRTNHQTERSAWGLETSYTEDSTRTDAADDTGDFTTQSIVTTKSISPSYSHQLTERDSISISASYSERQYSTTDYSDNETKSLTTAWQHQYTERWNGGVSVSVSNYKSAGINDSSENDNYNLSLTSAYELSELWNLSGQIGVRQLKSEQLDSFGNTEKNTNSGSSFNVTANKRTELDSLTIGISRSLSPSSTGEVNEQQGINLNWSRELSETLTASLATRYQETTSASDDGDEKRENINFSPSIRWQFERNLGLNFSYNYRQQKSSDEDDVDSNSVMLTLNYDWDGIRASR